MERQGGKTGDRERQGTVLCLVEYLDRIAYRYYYDKVGNIISMDKAAIADPTSETAAPGTFSDYRDYTYDDLYQMTRSVERFTNGTVDTEYTYDAYGNILSKAITKDGTTTTIPYTYGTDSDAGWSKLLTSYNGQTIDYDAIGNPTTYLGASLGWSNGRQLTSYTKDGNNITYSYDSDGLRVTKTVNGVKHTYLYVDGLLMYEKQYKANHTDIDMHFWYDANGHLSAVEYFNNLNDTWVLAYALTNSMGDVLGLYYGDGTLVTTYEYDAWGNLVYMNDTSALGVGTLNPIRYRGYYFDNETGLYYCQSRYYDPQVGRWINADAYVSTGQHMLGNNSFTYCYNNPANYFDSNGEAPLKVARHLFTHWVLGNGKTLKLKSASLVSRALKKSPTMKNIISNAIKKYENGEDYKSGSVKFKRDETDLWLGIRNANYKLSIKKEKRTTGFWWFKKKQTRYVVTVTVSDTYDFNIGNEKGDGIGSWLNNLGYWGQENNLGKSYKWEAKYVYKTKWI